MSETQGRSERGRRNLWRGAFAARRDNPSVVNGTKKGSGVSLITARPGPVLYVWRDGKELAAITFHAALRLAREILAALAAQSQQIAAE